MRSRWSRSKARPLRVDYGEVWPPQPHTLIAPGPLHVLPPSGAQPRSPLGSAQRPPPRGGFSTGQFTFSPWYFLDSPAPIPRHQQLREGRDCVCLSI
jgi:hypothetical protein